jgi:hypothetical protein
MRIDYLYEDLMSNYDFLDVNWDEYLDEDNWQAGCPLDMPITPFDDLPSEIHSEGMNCEKCNEFYPYAVPNQKNGTLICYSCRNF